jgi:hypothetical protein
MSLLDTIAGWWKQEQVNWTIEQVAPPAGLAADPELKPYGDPVLANTVYLRVKMRSMQVAATRKGWNLFHAALYSHVTLSLRNGSQAVLQTVLSPDFFRNIDPARLKNVVMVDRTLFGPVPYIGGSLAAKMGVFAVKDADLAAPLLGVLTDLAGAAGVSLVTAAKPFIGPIKQGVELLSGANATASLEIALDRDFDPPATGWFTLARHKAGTIKPGDLSVRPGNLELLHKGQSLSGVPYLLYSIDALTRRNDWAQIPELSALYNEFREAADRNDQNRATEVVKNFRRRATLSPELLPAHATEVVKSVEDELKIVFPGGATATDNVHRARVFGDLPVKLDPVS